MSEFDFYRVIISFIPDWLMAVLMFLAALICWRRYRIRKNRAIFALIFPLAGFALFYVWGTFFDPAATARLAAGRAVSFGLATGIILWGLLTASDKSDG